MHHRKYPFCLDWFNYVSKMEDSHAIHAPSHIGNFSSATPTSSVIKITVPTTQHQTGRPGALVKLEPSTTCRATMGPGQLEPAPSIST